MLRSRGFPRVQAREVDRLLVITRKIGAGQELVNAFLPTLVHKCVVPWGRASGLDSWTAKVSQRVRTRKSLASA